MSDEMKVAGVSEGMKYDEKSERSGVLSGRREVGRDSGACRVVRHTISTWLTTLTGRVVDVVCVVTVVQTVHAYFYRADMPVAVHRGVQPTEPVSAGNRRSLYCTGPAH